MGHSLTGQCVHLCMFILPFSAFRLISFAFCANTLGVQIQQAVMELSSNPMAMSKYQSDPDVMKVLNKMMEVFPQAGMPTGMPGMPPQK